MSRPFEQIITHPEKQKEKNEKHGSGAHSAATCAMEKRFSESGTWTYHALESLAAAAPPLHECKFYICFYGFQVDL